MKLVLKVTFDPFKVNAPDLRKAIIGAGVEEKDITEHQHRDSPKEKA